MLSANIPATSLVVATRDLNLVSSHYSILNPLSYKTPPTPPPRIHHPHPHSHSPLLPSPSNLGLGFSRVRVSMKMKINTACDLSSISVLPPHARNPASVMQGGVGRGGSQSQQSFSQMSFSQLSQNSFDDTLVNDQKFCSEERENSSRRSTSLAPVATTREESQMQLSRTSNNALQRWKLASAPGPDNRSGQISEEMDHRIRQMEGLLNRLVMILDNVQSDVMQVNRAVKEASLETEGMRQKIFRLDNSMQELLKGEEKIKSFLDQKISLLDNSMQEMLKGEEKIKYFLDQKISLLDNSMQELLKGEEKIKYFLDQKISLLDNSMQELLKGEEKIKSFLDQKIFLLDNSMQELLKGDEKIKSFLDQKISLLDNSMQELLKGEEKIKSFVNQSLKSVTGEIITKFDFNKLSEIADTVSVLPKQIEASLLKYQNEARMVLTKEMEVVANNKQSLKNICSAWIKSPDVVAKNMQPLKNVYSDRVKSPKVVTNGLQPLKNQCSAPLQSPGSISYVYTRRSKYGQIPPSEIKSLPGEDHRRKDSAPRKEQESCRTLRPKLTASKCSLVPKKEEAPYKQLEQFPGMIILDEESDGEVACLLVKKETGRAKILREEAEEETMRILRRARKRKRRQNSFLLVG